MSGAVETTGRPGHQPYLAYTPDGIQTAVVIANDHLIGDGYPLSTRPIPSEGLALQTQRSTAALLLARIINASMGIYDQVDVMDLPANQADLLNACEKAESWFADLFATMQADNGHFSLNPDAIVIDSGEDSAGPLFVIKLARGVVSALSLVDVRQGGVVYPAGSLFSLHIPHEALKRAYGDPYVRADLSSITAARFLRLAAFTEEPDQRQERFPVVDRTNAVAKTKLLRNASLDELRRIAQTAVSIRDASRA